MRNDITKLTENQREKALEYMKELNKQCKPEDFQWTISFETAEEAEEYIKKYGEKDNLTILCCEKPPSKKNPHVNKRIATS